MRAVEQDQRGVRARDFIPGYRPPPLRGENHRPKSRWPRAHALGYCLAAPLGPSEPGSGGLHLRLPIRLAGRHQNRLRRERIPTLRQASPRCIFHEGLSAPGHLGAAKRETSPATNRQENPPWDGSEKNAGRPNIRFDEDRSNENWRLEPPGMSRRRRGSHAGRHLSAREERKLLRGLSDPATASQAKSAPGTVRPCQYLPPTGRMTPRPLCGLPEAAKSCHRQVAGTPPEASRTFKQYRQSALHFAPPLRRVESAYGRRP
ncbi:MAG: hypothetical protein JWO38_5652 [Gemmataceae bacterium]|nr:hypothetical protein [Gemmataceae bacterium]